MEMRKATTHAAKHENGSSRVCLLCLLLVDGKPGVQTNAAHGLELYSFICTLATRNTCVLVYRANPASGHGIVTLHDRYVTIPCPALMTGVYKNTIESMHGVDQHLGFYDLDCLWLNEPSLSPAPFNLNLMVFLNRSTHG